LIERILYNMKTLNVLDLFCGCGGLSEGFRLAGYHIIGGVDFNSSAIDTYRKNFPEGKGICCDLLEMDKEKIVEMLGSIEDVNIIIGGPPCQGFSAANRYHLEEEDDRNKLFFEFVKFVDMAKPEAVLIENVRGIITNNKGYAKDRIYEIFEQRGYIVNHCILNAADYGIPQNRLRNFFVMLKKEKFDFATIKKAEKTITVEETIGELYSLENNDNDMKHLSNAPATEYQKYLRTEDTVY